MLSKDQEYDGWYLVQNKAGEEGQIPANYVEVSFLVYIPTTQRVYANVSRLFLLRQWLASQSTQNTHSCINILPHLLFRLIRLQSTLSPPILM